MERTIGVERLYPLGDYKNIKFTNIISNIPETVSGDYLDTLRTLQLVELDKNFREYLRLTKELHGLSLEDSLKKLDEMKEGLEAKLLLENPVLEPTE